MKNLNKNSTDDYISQDLTGLSSGRLYHILNAVVVPRPIAFVTTKNLNGVVNAAPFSWFNAVCTDPPIVSLSIAQRDGQLKDTARNILEHKEYVINTCHVDMAQAISKCAGDFPPEVSEVDLTSLDLINSHKVTPPRIANSRIQLECRLEKEITLGDSKVNLVLGRVVQIHLHKDLLDNRGRIDVMKLDPLARLNGNFYASLTSPFEIERG